MHLTKTHKKSTLLGAYYSTNSPTQSKNDDKLDLETHRHFLILHITKFANQVEVTEEEEENKEGNDVFKYSFVGDHLRRTISNALKT